MRLTDIFLAPAIPLFEGQNYTGMFDALIRLAGNERIPRTNSPVSAEVESFISTTKFKLRRNDRIVSYLRWVRFGMVYALQGGDENSIFTDMRNVYGREFSANGITTYNTFIQGERAFNRAAYVLGRFEHFLSLPIPAITERVWGFETPERLLEDFADAEKKWQDDRKGLLTPNPTDSKLINFGGGIAWWFLDRASCSDEANAMGHCGNSPRRDSSDRIISLRQEVRQGGKIFHKPFLTFILLDSGILGERKARFNNSPIDAAEKGINPRDFHPEIIALLKLPIVKGLGNGVYAPDDDFKIADLTEDEQTDLFQARPDLMSASIRFKRDGITEETTAAIIRELKPIIDIDVEYTQDIIIPQGTGIRIAVYENIEEMIDSLVERIDSRGGATARMAYRVSQGDENLEVFLYHLEEHQVLTILEVLESKHPEFYAQIANKVKSALDEDAEVNEITRREVAKGIIEYELFSNEMRDAILSAMKSGAEHEIHKEFTNWLDNIKIGRYSDIKDVEFGFDTTDKWTGPISVIISIAEAIRLLNNPPQSRGSGLLGEILRIRDLDEPYLGWHGFDAEVGAESLFENLDLDQ